MDGQVKGIWKRNVYFSRETDITLLVIVVIVVVSTVRLADGRVYNDPPYDWGKYIYICVCVCVCVCVRVCIYVCVCVLVRKILLQLYVRTYPFNCAKVRARTHGYTVR